MPAAASRQAIRKRKVPLHLFDVERLSQGGEIHVVRAQPQPQEDAPAERDGRVLSRMDPSTVPGHMMLERWARESRENETGWASTTLLGRVMEQGPGASQSGAPPTSMSEDSLRIDAFVCRLRRYARLHEFVHGYYIRRQSAEVIAKAARCTARFVREGLRRAREMILMWLECVQMGAQIQ